MPMSRCMYTKSIIRKQFRAECAFVCIPLRNFMGAPAPGAPMLPTPVLGVLTQSVFIPGTQLSGHHCMPTLRAALSYHVISYHGRISLHHRKVVL